MISVTGLRKSFGDVRALADVSLALADGESVVIAGPSGGGKTTLLRAIAGLEQPEAGTVVIDGRVATGPGVMLPPSDRGIAMAFQRPALWPHMTVLANVMFPLASMARSAARDRAVGLLGAVGLADVARRRPDELSAGQARRAALARALAPRAKHVLMDEPLVNLDPDWKDRALSLIREELSETGAAMLYVAHDREETASLASRTVRLEGGRLADSGEA